MLFLRSASQNCQHGYKHLVYKYFWLKTYKRYVQCESSVTIKKDVCAGQQRCVVYVQAHIYVTALVGKYLPLNQRGDEQQSFSLWKLLPLCSLITTISDDELSLESFSQSSKKNTLSQSWIYLSTFHSSCPALCTHLVLRQLVVMGVSN